jgi:hypothetical protein
MMIMFPASVGAGSIGMRLPAVVIAHHTGLLQELQIVRAIR